MQFTKLASILAAAALASAHTVSFQSLDETDRTIYFTSTNDAAVSPTQVSGGATVNVTLPEGWTGNWYSVSEGAENVPGMLGEVAFDSWDGISFFDVSAIVNPNDVNGVKEIYPAESKTPVSGCEVFPCDNAYYSPDDLQTKATSEIDLICTLGGSNVQSRAIHNEEAPTFKRDFVLGRWSR